LDNTPWLLNCENGTIDLKTGDLREHRREDLLTKIIPVEYDPSAKSPMWFAFLLRIMQGNEKVIRFLQKAAGYSLTGSVREQCFFLCYGTGANGKTVFLRTLLNVIGDYGKPVDPDLLLARAGETHPTKYANLVGVRLAVALETEEGKRMNEVITKWLTGGDKLSARFMRQDFFEFEPIHKIWIATNHKPIIRGTDIAIWRRVRLIPFNVTIPEEEQDQELIEKLRTELPGILNWLVGGCLAWQHEKLESPKEVKEATESYRDEMNTLGMFLTEMCVIKPGLKVKASDLHREYESWCSENGEDPISKRSLGIRLSESGFTRRRDNGSWWLGIGLRDKSTELKTLPGEKLI
jgi:putative DNA primase/helicase